MEGFSAATREWFSGAFSAPTTAQAGAWEAISRGENTLVVAPTGSGKTLAAFLWSLDRLASTPPPEEKKHRCRVLYVSPLKALAVDIERNLRGPLAGIKHAARRLGLAEPDLRVGIRSGDTPADERRRLVSRPPDILITTPESLFLLLTSQARESLRGVETVIIDEVHAVAATKRGSHLALSLERLDALLDRPAQRVGLSATVRPVGEVAAFLGGPRPATVVQPPSEKTFDLSIVVPVEDMSEVPQSGEDPRNRSIWPHVEDRVLDLIAAHRSTIIFANSRRLAERLCGRLNEITYERLHGPLTEDHSPAALMAQAGISHGTPQARDPWQLPPPHPVRPSPPNPTEPDPASVDLPGGAGVRDDDQVGPVGFDNDDLPSRADAGGLPGQAGVDGEGQAGAAGDGLQRVDFGEAFERLARRASHGGVVEVARAHHGSVSKEERAGIEDALKQGRLPAVVATSSLELGIDMGAVDLVVQVESPPSVASGLQRVGRAGHQVGAVSRGVIFPKYRGDLVQTAVVAERMREGEIEELRYPRNPLDVLAQQIVAMLAMDEWPVEELYTLVRRAAPYAALPRSAYEATLDMLAGRYPSEEFGELRPRIVWDRVTGVLRARRGAQRLAVVSGGTIPDRGLFGVFLVGEKSSRVGELDEEMVYESRVGDVFVLGASSWRIEDITPDRVLVSPAPGRPGKLPFWHGDSPGRPAELGRALGAFTRELGALSPEKARERASAAGLDPWAADNLISYLAEQKEATGRLPDDRTLVVERFRDELGDWRLIVHSPYGALVHAPWALAIAARLRERYGVDAQAMHADDGIVVRVPDTDEPPSADLVLFDPDEIERIVVDELGSSALFASRFRECAARSLLLPRHRPDRRMPLWQQRQRSAQLLAVASKYASFPIILETVRECLQDVFDVPGLVTLMRDLASRKSRITEVETPTASPYAQSLLFRYIAAFMYDGDSPLAERRAQALALDSALLSELMGQADLRELLDPTVLAEAATELQRLIPDRHAHDPDTCSDLLRALGPLTLPELTARSTPRTLTQHTRQSTAKALESDAAWTTARQPNEPDEESGPGARTAPEEVPERSESDVAAVVAGWVRGLEAERRAIRVRIGGVEYWAAVEDAARLRDGLGTPLPVGVPEAFLEPVDDPVGDLMIRYARTRVPFAAAEAAARFGVGVAVVAETLKRLPGVVEGEFTPGATGVEWVDSGVLRMLRRRSLARLRAEVEPSPPSALARFLPRWQGLGGRHGGIDALVHAIEQLQGSAVPASALETLILPSRVPGYAPALLDELTSAGEIIWAGQGSLPGGDGWISLYLADTAPLLLPAATDLTLTPVHRSILDLLSDGSAHFFRTLSDRINTPAASPLSRRAGTPRPEDADARPQDARRDRLRSADVTPGAQWPEDVAGDSPGSRGDAGARDGLKDGVGGRQGAERVADQELVEALWDLVWAGYLTNDTLAPVRAALGAGRPAHRARAGRRGRAVMPSRTGPPTAAGRWWLLPEADPGTTRRGHAQAEALLDRYGIVIRGAVAAEHTPGGFAAVYPVLRAFEENGRCRRGYFVDGLGAAQFALPGAVDRLRSLRDADEGHALVLAATDPANVYGAALPWPETEGGHRPGRKAGALVVLVDGELTLYAERGGKTFLTWNTAQLIPAVNALARAVREGSLGQVTVERVDGLAVTESPLAEVLETAGFHPTPRGFRLRR